MVVVGVEVFFLQEETEIKARRMKRGNIFFIVFRFRMTNVRFYLWAAKSSKLYAKSIAANAVHGSDSDENAKIEGDFFFSMLERF